MTTNIIPLFRKDSAINLLMDEMRKAIHKPEYNECSVAETIGILDLLKAELIKMNWE